MKLLIYTIVILDMLCLCGCSDSESATSNEQQKPQNLVMLFAIADVSLNGIYNKTACIDTVPRGRNGSQTIDDVQNANNNPNTDILSKCFSAVTNCEIYSIKCEVSNEKKTLEIVTTKSTWKTFLENLTRTLPVLIVTCIVLMLLWRIGKCYFTCKCAKCHKPCNVFSNQH